MRTSTKGGRDYPATVRARRKRWAIRKFGSVAAYKRQFARSKGIKSLEELAGEHSRKREEDRARRRAVRLEARANRPKHPLVERFIREHPKVAAKLLRPKSLLWRARYEYDPAFRAKQILRAHARKACRNWIDDGTLTASAIGSLFAKAKRCPVCSKRMLWAYKSLDHMVPKSKGGWHSIFNVRVICKACNTKKSTKFEQFTFGCSPRLVERGA
jgi:5-methylcytosine-specific restriction endonuclease McrA